LEEEEGCGGKGGGGGGGGGEFSSLVEAAICSAVVGRSDVSDIGHSAISTAQRGSACAAKDSRIVKACSYVLLVDVRCDSWRDERQVWATHCRATDAQGHEV
jgi:uncharacterized membrane protein